MFSLGIIATSLSRNAGGLFHSVRQSAIALAKSGVEVSVYGVEDQYTAEDLSAWAPLTPHVFSAKGPTALGHGSGMARAIGEANHDILHLHGIWQAPSLITQHADQPVMISPRGMLDPWALRNARWKKQLAGVLFERRNLRRAACLHALNQSELDAIRQFGLCAPVATIPNGTDIPDLEIHHDRPAWLPDDGKRTLLFLGRLHPKKGLTQLLRGWAAFRDETQESAKSWRLVIGGWDDGGHQAELEALKIELDLHDVILAGPLHGKEKADTFAHADAFILPSFSEGLPMAVLEAWSWALPVFMTEACNLPIGFSHGGAIQITPDPASICHHLRENLFANNFETRGLNGRNLASLQFAWTPIAEQHIEAYNWMLGRRDAPVFVEEGPTSVSRDG